MRRSEDPCCFAGSGTLMLLLHHATVCDCSVSLLHSSFFEFPFSAVSALTSAVISSGIHDTRREHAQGRY